MKREKMKRILVISAAVFAILAAGSFLIKKTGRTEESAAPLAESEKESERSANTVQAPVGGFDPKYVHSSPVSRGLAPDFIPLSGKLAFNAEKTQTASARAAGRLHKIFAFEADRVEKDQPLAELYSPDYLSAENEYFLARNTLRTLREMGNADLIRESEATFESAKNKLRVLGAIDEDLNQLEQTGIVAPYFIIRSPDSGIVTKRSADPGAYLNTGDPFETISDTSRLWFIGNIYEQDYAKIRTGLTLELQTEALPGKRFAGKLSAILPSIDPVTHTLSIRCEIPNPTGELRPEIFVTARLRLGEVPAVMVPKSAVLHIRNGNYIIVDRGAGSYQRVVIKSAPFDENQTAVLSGLTGSEKVVVEGATLINEMMGEI